MPIGPFDEIPMTRPPQKVRLEDINEMRRALTGFPSAAEYAAAVGAMESTATELRAEFAELDAAVSAVTGGPLPVTAGLVFRLDATTLGLADGARVPAWTDQVSGTRQAVQGTAGTQPRYDVAGINGRPAVYFDSARNDNLVASALAPASNYVTVFAVARLNGTPANPRYLFGTNGSAKNLYYDAFGRPGIQGAAAFSTTKIVPSSDRILTGVFNAAASAIRIDGKAYTADTGAATTPPTAFTIGHRSSLQVDRGFTGWIGELLYYDRVLTVPECAAVETYLAAKWRLDITPQAIWHVDSVLGNDANSGRSQGRALKTLGATFAAINNDAPADATVVIHAPAATPLRETNVPALATGGAVRLVSRSPGETWHAYGSQRFDGGWASLGGGVYSRTVTFPVAPSGPWAFLPGLLDSGGLPTRVWTRNTTTPATPAAGEYGYSGTTYYLHLPGDADPNLYRVEIATSAFLVNPTAGTLATITDGYLAGGQSGIVMAGATGQAGTVYAVDTTTEYSRGSGFATFGPKPELIAERCAARYVLNDGFNHHADAGVRARMILTDCEGAYNDDEGVSPHDDTLLVLVRGRYHHNGSGGLTAVTNSAVQLVDTEFDHNGRLLITEYGVNIDENATLVSTNLYSHDNLAGGVSITSTAPNAWTDHGGTRSGTAHGNGAADSV